MRFTIERMENGKLAARVDDVCWSEPVHVTSWYPICYERSIGAVEALIGLDCTDDCGVVRASAETLAAPGGWHLRNIRAVMTHLEKTMPVKWERHDIPKPKTKKEVRWHHGRWERLLAKGWV